MFVGEFIGAFVGGVCSGFTSAVGCLELSSFFASGVCSAFASGFTESSARDGNSSGPSSLSFSFFLWAWGCFGSAWKAV